MFRIKDYHLHLPHIGAGETHDLKVLYGIRILRDFVNKMSMFFLPIFLFLLGKDSQQLLFLPFNSFQTGMLVLCVYYILLGVLGFVTIIPLSRVFATIGYQRSFLFSFLLRALFFVILFFAKQDIRFLLIAVVTESIGQQLFWPGYYSILSKTTQEGKVGKEMGTLQLLLQLAGAITPAVSGAFAALFGFEYLFLISVVFALSTSFLSLQLSVDKAVIQVSYADFFAWLKEIRFIKLSASYAGKYVYDVLIFLWPLYIFLLLGSVDRVGYLYTFSLFIAIAITFFTGHYIDQGTSRRPFYISGGFLAAITVLRSQVFSIWTIALVDVLDKLTSNVYSLFFDTMFLKRSKGHLVESFFVYREMIVHATTVVFWSLAGVFFMFFSSWQALFLLGGIGVLVGLLMREEKYDS